MPSHRPGVALPDQMRDRQAAARSGVHVTVDHDQDPRYSSEAACFPEGWDTDPSRHTGENPNPCWGLAIDFIVSYHCAGCWRVFYGTSEEAVRRQVLEHQGRAK
jgi:hypothetical protein